MTGSTRFPDLTNLLLDAICVVDEYGFFLSVEGACTQIFGYEPEEMIGRQMLDMVYEPDRERTLHAVGRLMDGHLQYDFANRYIRKDGALVHILWSARWYKDKKIRVAVARDITEQKTREAQNAADSVPDAPRCWRLSGSPPSLTPPGAAPIALSTQDYRVLLTLASRPDAVSRKEIVEALGKNYLEYDQRRLDTQMRRLRRKVEQAFGLPLPVTTLRGVGYRFYEKIEICP